MKKILIIFVVFAFLISRPQVCFANVPEQNGIMLDDSLRLGNMVVTALQPEIQNAVNTFYSPYLTVLPTVAPFLDTDIIRIDGGEEIHTGSNNSNYTITVQVFPYVGPHDSVGKDHITLALENTGMVSILNFVHVESYELPPNLQSLLKKPLP